MILQPTEQELKERGFKSRPLTLFNNKTMKLINRLKVEFMAWKIKRKFKKYKKQMGVRQKTDTMFFS